MLSLRFVKVIKLFTVVAVLTGIYLGNAFIASAQQIGGPYKADSSTVLLMHFNEDLSNKSDSSADGTQHGSIQFIQNSGLRSELGSAVRIENGSPQDSSYITVPDTAALDLTGSWTIELWVNVFTFGSTSDDWRYQPRIVNKPGNPWYQANYWVYLRGGPRNFWTGYREDVGDGSYIEVVTPENTVEPGTWYHFAYIRDTTNNLLVQLLHKKTNDGSLKRVFFDATPFDPVKESPPTTNNNPLYIGNSHAEGGGFFLDGFMDELRISTTVRDYPMPPIIRSVEALGNQPAGQKYPISSKVLKLDRGQISSVKLHYRVNEGTWQSLNMAENSAEYTATIPSQSRGDIVQYYVEATDDSGRSALSPVHAVQDSNFYQFAVWKPKSKTLDLSFEGGSGTPVDSSLYENPVEVLNGDPVYSDDAAKGQYSMYLNDSTYLSVDSPFLTSDRSRTELWFKADSIIGGRRLIVSSAPTWYQANSQIWFTSTSIKAGGYFPESSPGYVEVTLDSAVYANRWYHAIYQVMQDSIMFELRDADNRLIQRKFSSHGGTNPIKAVRPLAIGNSPVDQHRFSGKVDEVKMYNYAVKDTVIKPDEPEDPFVFSTSISVTDQNDNSISLQIGRKKLATAGFDKKIDQLAPPPPPSGAFDARMQQMEQAYVRDIRGTDSSNTKWKLHLQASSNGNPINLRWDPTTLPDTGQIRLTARTGLSVDMRSDSTVSVSTDQISTLTITHQLKSRRTITLRSGWNLIGLPVEARNTHYLELFPGAQKETLFGFAGTYSRRDSLRAGAGYWLRFSNSGTREITGIPLNKVKIQLQKGWNLVAGLSDSVNWSKIRDPSGVLIDQTLYGFTGSYQRRSALAPGRGYWVRASSRGTITLQSSNTKQKEEPPMSPRGFAELIIRDATGHRQTLYFDGQLKDGTNKQKFSMPPLPPEGAFDARFKNDRRLREKRKVKVQLQGAKSPLTIKLDGKQKGRVYQVKNGQREKLVSSAESATFDQSSIQTIKIIPVEESAIPKKYRLEANYPNPFNPATTIRYGLPEKAKVRLTVYNISGRRVTRLVDKRQKAGWHTVQFDASRLASGVYIYELVAGDFQTNRKMLLLK